MVPAPCSTVCTTCKESTHQYEGNGGKRNVYWRARDCHRTPALCCSKRKEEIIIQHIDTSIDYATEKKYNAECPTAAAGIHRTRVADTAHRVSRITSATSSTMSKQQDTHSSARKRKKK